MRLAPMLVFALVASCSPHRVVSGRELVEAPDRFDGRDIVLTGIVQDPRRGGRSADAGYTTFTLLDGGARVPVAARGPQPVNAGDVVEVRGVFREQTRVGGDLLVDTVDAESVRRVRSATQPPGPP